MIAILVNYNYDPEDWWLDYGFKPEDVILYDRSDDGFTREYQANVVHVTENIGQVDYDKLDFIVENYHHLPEVFLWAKTNLFKSVDEETFKKALENKAFSPLLRQDHKTFRDEMGVVCYYENGIYHERNNSWYFWELPSVYRNYDDFARDFQLPSPPYIPFNPGGNFILTRERVHRYSKDYYEKMRDILPHAPNPAEAHCLERSYYTLWK